MNNLTSLTICFDDGDDDDFAVGATKKITRQEIASLNAPSIVECRRGVDGRRATRPADRDFKREAERYKKFCLKSINTRTDVIRLRRLSLCSNKTPLAALVGSPLISETITIRSLTAARRQRAT